MKVFVQIPCLNEEKTLPLVLSSIPKKIPGVEKVEILVIDDGSTDKTVEVAKKLGVKHFVHHAQRRGLARSFQDGVEYALGHGADIVVNTDGDNQYPQERIADLVQPILRGEAEIVIADRQTDKIKHFSPLKKSLQKFGSRVVNMAAGTKIPDAASGFRAYSKKALLEINVVTDFSYCMETIVHAGRKRIPLASIPVTTNPKTRESRLFNNMWQHVGRSGAAIVRSYSMHQPFKVFSTVATIMLILGLLPFLRYLWVFIFDAAALGQHLQSLILGAVLIILGVLFFAVGLLADLVKINRKLLEDALAKLKEIQSRD